MQGPAKTILQICKWKAENQSQYRRVEKRKHRIHRRSRNGRNNE